MGGGLEADEVGWRSVDGGFTHIHTFVYHMHICSTYVGMQFNVVWCGKCVRRWKWDVGAMFSPA